MSTPDKPEFHIDTTFTGRDVDYIRPTCAVIAAVMIVLIIATMTTNVAARLLPMSDEYLQVMIPPAPDGAEPLGLASLTHEINDKAISIAGTLTNRTDHLMSNVLAVIEMQDTTGRFPQTQEIAVMPADLEPHAIGSFMAMATLQEKPGGYIIKFRFEDGPFIPHKDERSQNSGDQPPPPSISISPVPTIK